MIRYLEASLLLIRSGSCNPERKTKKAFPTNTVQVAWPLPDPAGGRHPNRHRPAFVFKMTCDCHANIPIVATQISEVEPFQTVRS